MKITLKKVKSLFAIIEIKHLSLQPLLEAVTTVLFKTEILNEIALWRDRTSSLKILKTRS